MLRGFLFMGGGGSRRSQRADVNYSLQYCSLLFYTTQYRHKKEYSRRERERERWEIDEPITGSLRSSPESILSWINVINQYYYCGEFVCVRVRRNRNLLSCVHVRACVRASVRGQKTPNTGQNRSTASRPQGVRGRIEEPHAASAYLLCVQYRPIKLLWTMNTHVRSQLRPTYCVQYIRIACEAANGHTCILSVRA